MNSGMFSVFCLKFPAQSECTRHSGTHRASTHKQVSPLHLTKSTAIRPQSSPLGWDATGAFTLLEVLVAVAVLSMMLTFMFSLLGSSLTLWETGNRRIEAAQSARVGLNIMANDLKNAFAGNMTSFTSNGTTIQNIAPFFAIDEPINAIDIPEAGQAVNADGSAQVYGVLSSGDPSEPYKEFGYLCVFLSNKIGTDPMIGHRYYLIRKVADGSDTHGDFFLRTPGTAWAGTSTDFSPIIDNCIRLEFLYYGNSNNPNDSPEWTPEWTANDRLPLGVLATATVLDSRTAEKIASINGGSALSQTDIDAVFTMDDPSNPIQRLLRQGAVTVRRFIPFNSN